MLARLASVVAMIASFNCKDTQTLSNGKRVARFANIAAVAMRKRRIGLICAGQRAITPDTALRLAIFFGTDAQSCVNLQAHYDTELVREAMADVLTRIHRYEFARA